MTVNGINMAQFNALVDEVGYSTAKSMVDDALAKQGAKVAKQPIKDTIKLSKHGKKVAKASVGKNAKAATSAADNPGMFTKIKETVTGGFEKVKEITTKGVDNLKKTKIGKRVEKGIKDFKKTETGKQLKTGVGKFAEAVKKHPIAAVAVTALAAIIGTKLLSGGSDKVE